MKKSPVWRASNHSKYQKSILKMFTLLVVNLLISYSFNEHFITRITLLCMVGATPDTNKTWYNQRHLAVHPSNRSKKYIVVEVVSPSRLSALNLKGEREHYGRIFVKIGLNFVDSVISGMIIHVNTGSILLAEIYIQSAPNNSNETHSFMCLGRAGHFGQH